LRFRSAQDAVIRVAQAIVQEKTRVIDIDLRGEFDNLWHDRLLAKVAIPSADSHSPSHHEL